VNHPVLDVVKAVIRLSKGARLQILGILRAEMSDLWQQAERAYVADRLERITASRRKPPNNT
jgi:hypothetical protein